MAPRRSLEAKRKHGMNRDALRETPHRRWNPLVREWVLVSPQRLKRPWQGQVSQLTPESRPQYDPECYLCPGNARAGGQLNPDYRGTLAFDNDFPALVPGAPGAPLERDGLFLAEPERGVCRVLCFSPRHDLTIPLMSQSEVEDVVNAWIAQNAELTKIPWVRYVEIFENRGVLMGASNAHPHCQIWATGAVANLPAREQAAFREYQQSRGECLLCRYVELELQLGERIICQNPGFVALVPYWAVWPFEALVVSRRHLRDFAELQNCERSELAGILRHLTIRYDNLFETEFPYSMGFHQQPQNPSEPECHFHAHYYPPLLRSATVQKFMVGYELLAGPQRDTTPEMAAERLRGMPEKHYLDRR
jgi:UDPglucose--hexose-1-phosphate uridylyltransferase